MTRRHVYAPGVQPESPIGVVVSTQGAAGIASADSAGADGASPDQERIDRAFALGVHPDTLLTDAERREQSARWARQLAGSRSRWRHGDDIQPEIEREDAEAWRRGEG